MNSSKSFEAIAAPVFMRFTILTMLLMFNAQVSATVKYSFAGPYFTDFGLSFQPDPGTPLFSYDETKRIEGYFTLASPLGENMPLQYLTPDLLDFFITDGVSSVTLASPNLDLSVLVSTDPLGLPLDFFIDAFSFTADGLLDVSIRFFAGSGRYDSPDGNLTIAWVVEPDFSYWEGSRFERILDDDSNLLRETFAFAEVESEEAVSWARTVPEPATIILLGLGVAGIVYRRRRCAAA